MTECHHLVRRQVLGVRLADAVVLPGDAEGDLDVALPVDGADLLEQGDDVRPFEVVRERMLIQRVERRAVRLGQRFPVAMGSLEGGSDRGFFHDTILGCVLRDVCCVGACAGPFGNDGLQQDPAATE
jgi:hypothetical protein